MRKWIIGLSVFILLLLGVYFIHPSPAEDAIWGVNFSEKQAEHLGLDWKEVYLAALTDLDPQNIKLAVHWDLLEPTDGGFYFENIDWQMDKASENDVGVLLSIGMKTPRWPECHLPSWLGSAPDEEEVKRETLEMLEVVVDRYKDHPALYAWQVENEPLVNFGECPFKDIGFLEKELELVSSLDPDHDITTSDSGELSTWLRTAKRVGKLGTTQYQKVWSGDFNMYMPIVIPRSLYGARAWLVDRLYGTDVFVGELQTEPWVEGELTEVSVEEMEKTMSIERFRSNVDFARKTGIDEFYLWGTEWWYYMKEVHSQPIFWEEAKTVIN